MKSRVRAEIDVGRHFAEFAQAERLAVGVLLLGLEAGFAAEYVKKILVGQPS